MEQTDCHIHSNTLKIPAVYLKRTQSADCIWICTVQHEVLCWNWQHSADGSNWNRLTATFTVTHWTPCINITHCCVIWWVFSAVSKEPSSFETSVNNHQTTRCHIQDGLKPWPQYSSPTNISFSHNFNKYSSSQWCGSRTQSDTDSYCVGFRLLSAFTVDIVDFPFKPILFLTILTAKKGEINLVIKNLNNNYLTDRLTNFKEWRISQLLKRCPGFLVQPQMSL